MPPKLLARHKERPCGSFGDISTFSFYPNKHITTGEGGMVLTDQPEIAERCKSMRNLALETETDLNMNRWVGIFA